MSSIMQFVLSGVAAVGLAVALLFLRDCIQEFQNPVVALAQRGHTQSSRDVRFFRRFLGIMMATWTFVALGAGYCLFALWR